MWLAAIIQGGVEGYALLLMGAAVLLLTLVQAARRPRASVDLARSLRELSSRHRHTTLGLVILVLILALAVIRGR